MAIEQTATTELSNQTQKRGPWRDRAMMFGLFALVIFGLIGAAAATGWEETLTQIKKLTWAQVALLLALSLANYGLRGLRWHIFTHRLGLPLGLIANLRHFMGGFAMTVTPGRLGELVRMRWIRRETGWAVERTAPLVIVDRAADLIAMALLMVCALLVSGTKIAGGPIVVAIALGVAFLATRPKLLAWAATVGHSATGRLPRLFAKVRRSALSLEPFSKGGALFSGTILGILGWLAEGVAFYLLLEWMGADVSLGAAIAIFVFSTLAGGMTGAPGGVGGAEAAMIALLALEGVPLAMSLPATAIIRLTTLWFAILIGLFIFPVAERVSKRVEHDLEHG